MQKGLASHGAEFLREVMEEGLKEQRFDVSFVEQFLQGKLHFSGLLYEEQSGGGFLSSTFPP